MDLLDDAMHHAFKNTQQVVGCCGQVQVKVQCLLKEFGGDLAIGNGQLKVHEHGGLGGFGKLPFEFSKLVDLPLEILPSLVIVV